jgi:hypothetical protein
MKRTIKGSKAIPRANEEMQMWDGMLSLAVNTSAGRSLSRRTVMESFFSAIKESYRSIYILCSCLPGHDGIVQNSALVSAPLQTPADEQNRLWNFVPVPQVSEQADQAPHRDQTGRTGKEQGTPTLP